MSKTNSLWSKEPEADPWNDLNFDDPELLQLLDNPLPAPDGSKLRTNAQHDGFDDNVGDTWIYPNNLPNRAYQFSITQAALYRNTLVVLPTGLGKTFIAAVVMYNLYRWYPTGKVIFMAPTRPLVAQQIEVCQRIMPFPTKDTVELTGKLQRNKRIELWRSKRVFFATPQVVQSDIVSADNNAEHFEFPYSQIKLIVFDEAHKAKGRYAYTEVAQAIWQRNRYCRVLALSATPGRTMEDVAEVVRNLFISHLEVRCDNSIDVMPYVHHRHMKTIVVPLGEDIKTLREQLLQIIDPYLRQLIDEDVLSGSLANINRNFLLYEQKRFRERSQRHAQQSAVSTNFAICISLYHSLELLERHGLRVFLNNFDTDEEGRAKFVLTMDRRLRDLVGKLREQLGPNPFDVSTHAMTNGQIAEMPPDLDFGHPKFEHARRCVLQHFEQNAESRAIVFCEYRESVMLIYRLLLQHKPLLKPRCFVGQGGSTGSLRALTQKQQIQIMSDFRAGISNILIATSIGEEGIDVGEVELIVCFDMSTSNPTRFIQRIGRTGRKKQGHVVLLVTEGREQDLLKDVLANKDAINKKLMRSTVVKGALYQHAPRLVPTEYNPQCVHTYIKPPDDDCAPEQKKAQGRPEKAPKKTAKTKAKSAAATGSQDLRNFFKAKPALDLDVEEAEHFEMSTTKAKTPPKLNTQESSKSALHKIEEFLKDIAIDTASSTQLLATPQKKSTRNANATATATATTATDEHADTFVPTPADLERWRRINKWLASKKPMLPTDMCDADFLTLFKAVSEPFKLLMLKLQPEIVREARDQFKVVNALDEEPDQSMSEEEQKIRETYELIAELLGGESGIDAFLDDVEYERYKQQCNEEDDFFNDDDWEAMGLGDFEESVEKAFAGFEDLGPLHDNHDYVEAEFKKTAAYKRMMAEEAAPAEEPSMVYETMLDMEEEQQDYSITESKYCSQWNDFAEHKMANKSTPNVQAGGSLVKAIQKQAQAAKNLLYKLTEGFDDDDDEEFVSFKRQEKAESHKEKPTRRVQAATVAITSRESTPDLDFEVVLKLTTPKRMQEKTTTTIDKMHDELDFDLTAFLEPFPEEEQLCAAAQSIYISPPSTATVTTVPTIETLDASIYKSLTTPKMCRSPNLFTEQTPIRADVRKSISAEKLAATSMRSRTMFLTPTATTTTATIKPTTPVTPKSQPVQSSPKYEKSPSIFDIYLENMRGRIKMPKNYVPTSTTGIKSSTEKANESVIARTSTARTTKRKIIDSDSSSGKDETPEFVDNKEPAVVDSGSETDCEEILATQLPNERYFPKQRQQQKRPRLCAFIDQEAAASGKENSEDETEQTIDNFMLDSVVVSSDESDNVTSTQAHAMYLQSLKSPKARLGNFKIPAFRVFNDQADIYSQPVPIEQSQDSNDSFIVDEDAEPSCVVDKTMSPLERAEQILKARRRAKRQYAKVGFVNNRKETRRNRIVRILESSEEDTD